MDIQYLLKSIFTDLDQPSIESILGTGHQIRIGAGKFLFKQHEDRHEMYIVISGRLRAIKEEEQHVHILGEIGPGETVGELAFFSDEPRMASVLAIRETVLLEFSPEDYLKLIAHNPELAKSLIKLVIRRLKRNAFESHQMAPPKNIALINLVPGDDSFSWFNPVLNHLSDIQVLFKVFTEKMHSLPDRDQVFTSMEDHEGMNLLICGENDLEWSQQCLLYADLVVVAADFLGPFRVREIEQSLRLYQEHILRKKTYLLLVHPSDADPPQHTSQWLTDRNVEMSIHFRKDNQADGARLARILTHRATGLVLGGGGAKGFAHIGVVRALMESGISIDFLGGTSAGALYGIGMSYAGFDLERIYSLNEEAVKRRMTRGDLAFPMVSLKEARKFRAYLKEMYGDCCLEDLWINSYCVSANLSTAEVKVHDQGLAWKKVLASMAIPGVFPPVVIHGFLHVDGGIMDNLPIDPMYKYPVNTIIAVSLSPTKVRMVDFEEVPGSWSLLRDKIAGGKNYRIPGLASMIINSMTINSVQRQEESKDKVSHYIELDLKGVGMMDEKKWREIIDKGYEQTKEYLRSSGLVAL